MALFALWVVLAGFHAHASQAISPINHAAVLANWAVYPQHAFNMLKYSGFIVHVFGGKNGLCKTPNLLKLSYALAPSLTNI